MKFQPVYEYQDGRGHSIRYSHQRDKRRRARKRAEKIMGKSYFTNPKESLELSHGYKHDDRRPRVSNL
jgi:hypothetical protein